MSKAREYSNKLKCVHEKLKELTPPTFTSNINFGGWFTARVVAEVTQSAILRIHFKDFELEEKEALQLGKWLIETFGEKGKDF